MWKKEEDQAQQSMAAPSGSTATRSEPVGAQARKSGFATIGPSIVIRGEVTGDEDLLIQGQVDGSVALGLHSVTIGDGGRVKAGVTGRVITVEGAVEGDLTAKEQIVLRGTARVKGDLNAPRVVLEDGATFRGLVDMGKTPDVDVSEPRASKPAAAKGASSSSSKPDAESKSADRTESARSANGSETSRSAEGAANAASTGAQKSASG